MSIAKYLCGVVGVTAFLTSAACHRSAPSSPPTAQGQPTATSAPPRPSLPEGVTTEMIEAGDAIFNNRSCKNCHLPNGVGGPRGPSLVDDKWIHIDGSYPAIVKLVTTGFTKSEQVEKTFPFSMNPRGGVNLTDVEINAVAAYVWSL